MKEVNRRASVSEGVTDNNLRSRELITGMNRNEKSEDRLVMRRTPPLEVMITSNKKWGVVNPASRDEKGL